MMLKQARLLAMKPHETDVLTLRTMQHFMQHSHIPRDKMKRITLNQTEMQMATLNGMGRMVQNQINGISSQGRRKLDPDINGAGGEIAVAKYFNRYPDLSIGPHRRGWDLEVNRRTIDVKTTTYQPGYLQAKTYKKIKDADMYILVHAAFPIFTIIGGVKSEELMQEHNIKDMGYGPNYTLEQSQLHPLKELFE